MGLEKKRNMNGDEASDHDIVLSRQGVPNDECGVLIEVEGV